MKNKLSYLLLSSLLLVGCNPSNNNSNNNSNKSNNSPENVLCIFFDCTIIFLA